MMGAGAIDEPQVIAPSSNDWDYTFNTSNDWKPAGNSLGDHTDGGYFAATNSSTSGLSSLITLDGDFEIEWTMADPNQAAFGVHAIDEDDSRSGSGVDACNMGAMTNSFYYRDESTDFYIGSSAQSDTMTFGDGSVIKIERVSGTIKVYDDGVVVHTYGTTYSGAMRFAAGTPGSPIEANFDNFKITDTDKVQRDGFFNEGTTAGFKIGDGQGSSKNGGRLLKSTRSGNVTSIKYRVAEVVTAYTGHFEIWEHDGTNPSSKIGQSDSTTFDTVETNQLDFTTQPEVQHGKQYWIVVVDETTAGNVRFGFLADLPQDGGCGVSDTITSITANQSSYFQFEMIVDTSTGEPTPDHDTLLLIHSDTSDGSTTFTDSSQNGRTITVAGDAQHDTAQKKFGTSSMYFDGTGDYATAPDHADWDFSGDFTVDFWGRVSSAFSAQGDMVGIADGGSYASMNFICQLDASRVPTFYFGGGSVVLEGSAIAIDTWVHFAFVRVGSRFNLYQAGTSTDTATSTSAVNAKSIPFTIGRRGSGDNYFKGWLDEVRVSNVARWDANFTPPSAPYP